MPESTRERFGTGAAAWHTYNLGPLGSLRQELTWQNLVPYLPDCCADHSARVLDAGGGSGELALRLLQHGCQVWLLDYAPEMLEQAGRAAQELGVELGECLTLCAMDVEEAEGAFSGGFFDVITCHTLIEYLEDPLRTLGSLANLLRTGGVVSVSFVNRHAEVLRQVWSHTDPGGALAKLKDPSFCAALFDVKGKGYTPDEVAAWLDQLGFSVVSTCGVRVFADFVPQERLRDPAFLDALLRLEMAVSARSPYNLLARYTQVIAIKESRPGIF